MPVQALWGPVAGGWVRQTGLDGRGDAAVSGKPSDGAFHHLPARQDGEGRHGQRLDIDGVSAPAPRVFHEHQSSAALLFAPCPQPLPAIGPVRPDRLQARAHLVGGGQKPGDYVGIPQIGGMHEDTQQETRRVHEGMTLAATVHTSIHAGRAPANRAQAVRGPAKCSEALGSL